MYEFKFFLYLHVPYWSAILEFRLFAPVLCARLFPLLRPSISIIAYMMFLVINYNLYFKVKPKRKRYIKPL